jgi:hypothetical protein
VALVEDDADDSYLVVSARHLTTDEVTTVRKIIEGDTP